MSSALKIFTCFSCFVGVDQARGVGDGANGDQPADLRAEHRDLMERFFQFERRGDQPSEQLVGSFGAERTKDGTHNIFQRRKSGLFFIDVNYNFAAGAEKGKQAAKRAGYVRTMLQHPHAENFVEGSFAQRDFINAGLKHGKIRRAGIVSPSGLDREAQIECENIRARFQGELSETAGATAGFEDAFAVHTRGPAGGLVKTIAAQIVLHYCVHLDGVKTIPLKPEGIGIGLRRHKSRKIPHDGDGLVAVRTFQRAFGNFACGGILRDDGGEPKRLAAFQAGVHVESIAPHLSLPVWNFSL